MPGGIATRVHADKSLFSMWYKYKSNSQLSEALANHILDARTPEVRQGLSSLPTPLECVIIGIETHICITQTALDLLREGHKVYVLADGVSSCNKEEIPIALARLRSEGAVVTTSESWIYECMGDAGIEE